MGKSLIKEKEGASKEIIQKVIAQQEANFSSVASTKYDLLRTARNDPSVQLHVAQTPAPPKIRGRNNLTFPPNS